MEGASVQISSKSSRAVKAILDTREEISPYLEKLEIENLSQHNKGYMRYVGNPVRDFIDKELLRHLKTVDFVDKTLPRGADIMDIGFFIPIVPIALSKLGFRVSAIEKLDYYGDSLRELILLATESYGITIHNLDILNDELRLERYSAVLLLAILEHLNGTPRLLLERAKRMADRDGYIVIDVPNAASLSRRLLFLFRGIPPYAPFSDYFHSDYPFAGHNREYTITDLKYALAQAGLEIIRMDVFHHSSNASLSMGSRLVRFIERLGPTHWKPTIWVAAKPN
jgi:hypothetical protein